MKKFIVLLMWGVLMPILTIAQVFVEPTYKVETPYTGSGTTVEYTRPGEFYTISCEGKAMSSSYYTIQDKFFNVIDCRKIPGFYQCFSASQYFFNDDDDFEYFVVEEVTYRTFIVKIMQVFSGECIAQSRQFSDTARIIPTIYSRGDAHFLRITDDRNWYFFLIDKEAIGSAQPVLQDKPMDNRMYNLNGQEIYEPHGLYIQNGEKKLKK